MQKTNKPATLGEIADLVRGELKGSASLEIKGIEALDSAQAGHISFAVNTSFKKKVEESKASAFVLPSNWPGSINRPSVMVKDPYLAYALISRALSQKEWTSTGISDRAVISEDCAINENVSIHPFVFVGRGALIEERVTLFPGVYIGENVAIKSGSVLYPNVTVYDGCRIGVNVIIHAGSVIGSDGFGYAQDRDMHVKIPQKGIVVIEDEVEIGSNVSIDRATFGKTLIGKGSKIDNLVQIAHNVTVGPGSILVSQVGIAGSTRLGKGVMIGGQTGVTDHVELGDQVRLAARSGVTKSIPAGSVYSGAPALPHRQSLRIMNAQKALPDIIKEVRELKKRLDSLEGGLKDEL